VFKAFVYRLYPSKSQRGRLEAVRQTCRHFYNHLLRERKDAYEFHGISITKAEQLRKVKLEKATSPYALDIHILQVVVADLDKAFQAFFRRVQAGENPGYPRFKSRNRFAGFGFKEYGNGFKVDGRRLKLSGIGRIAVPLAPPDRRDDQDRSRVLPSGQVVRRVRVRGREAPAAAEDRGVDWHRPGTPSARHAQQR
jgi:putative transposase